MARLTTLYIWGFFTNFTFEDNALSGLDELTYLYIWYLQTNLDLFSRETFPSLIRFDLSYSQFTTLEQAFFQRQKNLYSITAYSTPFHCDCKMAWINYAVSDLNWSIYGICDTPSLLNGNSIVDSSNYFNCPSNQSYHCFSNTFICPPESSCVNTADSAYCDCGDGYTFNETSNLCEEIDQCSASNCEHICTNSVGSYTCSCFPGYSLVSSHVCIDFDECSSTNNCDHICTNSVGSFTCSCLPGYSLVSSHVCIDFDECSSNKCEHICTNTVGSYICSCLPGFTLELDLFSCVSSGDSQLTSQIFIAITSLLLLISLL